eukprot:4204787-Pyramimonas_sp.AAC.1
MDGCCFSNCPCDDSLDCRAGSALPSSSAPNVSLLCACMCDAFLHAHHCASLGLPGAAQQDFEARLRLLTRRHVVVAEAWEDIRAGPGRPVPAW